MYVVVSIDFHISLHMKELRHVYQNLKEETCIRHLPENLDHTGRLAQQRSTMGFRE